MPTYEFRCPAGHEFERFFQRISDAPREVQCAECGETAERLISGGAGLVFKGSGFYITDYGKDGKKDQRQRGASGSGRSEKPASGGDSATGGVASAENSGGAAKSDAAKSDGGGATGAGKGPGGSSTGGSSAAGGSSTTGGSSSGGDK